jgi:hypothetical protein
MHVMHHRVGMVGMCEVMMLYRQNSSMLWRNFWTKQASSEEDFTLVVSLNEYILRGDAVGTSCTYVDSRV